MTSCTIFSQGFQARLEKVVVDAVSENTYFAQLYVTQHDTTMIADARPVTRWR